MDAASLTEVVSVSQEGRDINFIYIWIIFPVSSKQIRRTGIIF